MTDDELRAHIAKMEGIHGDEPIRIKIALKWAKELLEARQHIKWLEGEAVAETHLRAIFGETPN